jgi:WD40 repeat protein
VEDFKKACAPYQPEILLLNTPIRETIIAENPYKGLKAFEEADASNFFGRTALIQHLLTRLQDPDPYQRFLAVVGPSGSGKSSVIQAGLIPSLRADAIPGSTLWFYALMTPGDQPLIELQHAILSLATRPIADLDALLRHDPQGLLRVVHTMLPDQQGDLLLVVDQFEEVFTQAADPREAQQFLRLIQTAITAPDSRVRVIVTLRADFYDRPLSQPDLGELMRKRTEIVIPLRPEELEEAITQPLIGTGIELEAGLAAEIISDLNDQPGALPMLQYLLTELFDQRTDRVLTRESYHALGGVQGALARRADEVYNALTPEQQPLARQLFLRLVTLGEGTEDTRRRALLSEIRSIAPQIGGVIDAFDRSRLLTFDRDPISREPTVEIAHEAIIREWKRLGRWLDEGRSDVRLERLLAQEAANWLNAGRDDSYLLRDARLVQFAEWTARTDLVLTPIEQNYIESSVAAQRDRDHQEQDRKAREIQLEQSAKFRTRLLRVIGFAAVIALLLTLMAVYQAVRATASEQEALQLRAQSASLALSSLAQRTFLQNNDAEFGIALALAANQTENPPPIAIDTLAQVALAPGTRRLFTSHNTPNGLTLAQFSPDGQNVLVGSYSPVVIDWNLNTGERRDFNGIEGESYFYSAKFNPRRDQIAAINDLGEIVIWDRLTTERLQTLTGHTAEAVALSYSPDGLQLASVSYDNRFILWDTTSGAIQHDITLETPAVSVVYNTDGTQIVTGTFDGDLIVWDAQNGQPINRFKAHAGELWYLAFLDTNRVISAVFNDYGATDLKIHDINTGQLIATLPNQTASVSAFALSPDKNYVALAYADSSIVIWNLPQRRLIRVLRGHRDLIYGLDFSPDNRQIFSTDLSGQARLWDLRSGQEVIRSSIASPGYTLAEYTPDGTRILVGYHNGRTALLDAITMAPIWSARLTGDPLNAITISPDAQSFAIVTAGETPTILIGDLNSGELRATRPHDNLILSLGFVGSAERLMIGDRHYNVWIWNITTDQIEASFDQHEATISAIAVSADGALAISGTGAGDYNLATLILWDLVTGAPRHILNPGSVVSVTLSPDQTRFAAGLSSGEVIIGVSATGEILRTLRGHSGVINSVRFSADGTQLISASDDQTMIVWDVWSGGVIRTIFGHTGWVRMAAFQPNGAHILSASEDGTVRQWRVLPNSDLLRWTYENRYVREVTCEERARYSLEPLCPVN